MEVIVFGNVTLDIICRTVNDVPRHESISFDNVVISPGGCASNVAIGLQNLGISTAIVCRLGNDVAAKLIESVWHKFNIDLRYLKIVPNLTTAVSVGLIDKMAQPRFIHTPGANATLKTSDLDLPNFIQAGAKHIHIAGFFVLPGLFDGKLAGKLKLARKEGLKTSLDIVLSPRYWKPEFLWPCLPEIDYFMCNKKEAYTLTDEADIDKAANNLITRGANIVLIKLGSKGCYYRSGLNSGLIPAYRAKVIDTTGAGDAFAAGFIAAIRQQKELVQAIIEGNKAGIRMISVQGAIGGWL